MSNEKWDKEKNLTLTSWKVWEFVPFTTNVPVPKVIRTMGTEDMRGKDNEVKKLMINAAAIIATVGTKSKRAVMAMSKS